MQSTEEFLEAVKAGDADRVRTMLAADPTLISTRDAKGVSAMLTAIYRGQPEIARIFIDRGAVPDIHEACALGDADRARAILDADPALIHTVGADGHYPLGLACFFGRPELVDLLLERGADVNATAENGTGIRPVHAAAACRDEEAGVRAMRSLIAHDAELNVTQHGGWTPLHQAAHAGNVPLTELLLEHGADVHVHADDGTTALDKALEKGHEAAAELLRGKGAAEPG